MFTKRHEEQLAEIKALTYELGQRFDEILEELERIKKAQENSSKPRRPRRIIRSQG